MTMLAGSILSVSFMVYCDTQDELDHV